LQQEPGHPARGQLSDRIKVNLLQNSANQIPLANRIAINYKGDEDDLVQAFDLGKHELTLPGTQYVSYSGRNEGLFGVKTTLRYGPLDFTVLASKQVGQERARELLRGASSTTQTLADYDYVRASTSSSTTRAARPSTSTRPASSSTATTPTTPRNLTTVARPGWADLSWVPRRPPTRPTRCRQFTQLKAGSDGDYEILRTRLRAELQDHPPGAPDERGAAAGRDLPARTVDAGGAGVGEYAPMGTADLAEDASGCRRCR